MEKNIVDTITIKIEMPGNLWEEGIYGNIYDYISDKGCLIVENEDGADTEQSEVHPYILYGVQAGMFITIMQIYGVEALQLSIPEINNGFLDEIYSYVLDYIPTPADYDSNEVVEIPLHPGYMEVIQAVLDWKDSKKR